jgi:DNA-directed RNA polymerase specialized sigma24 family protein
MLMRDSEIVASIKAGDSGGLAEAYDKYAGPLYEYCLCMLGHPGDAADAVQDTFVIAATRAAGLRAPERLRAWLYAVARGECLRTTRGAQHSVEREALELQSRHGFGTSEVAAVLGVSGSHAHSLLSRARDQGGSRPGRPGPSSGAAVAAAAHTAGLPAALRAHTLALAAGQDPGAVAHRAAVLGRAGKFGMQGFPKPAYGQPPARWRLAAAGAAGARGTTGAARPTARGQFAVAGLMLSYAIPAITFALIGAADHAELPVAMPARSTAPLAVRAPASATPGKTPGTPAATPSRTASWLAAAPAPVTAASTPGASSASPPPVTLTVTPTPGATGSTPPSRAPSPAPTPTVPVQPTPRPTPTPSPAPSPGTLAVFPGGGPLLVPPDGTTIYLTARGGPVTWSITVSGGPGDVGVSASSGTLADGAGVAVTITASDSASGEQVTVSPGGAVFTIVVDGRHGHGHHHRHKGGDQQ